MLGVRDECVMFRAFILNQKRRTFSVDVAKGEYAPKLAQADILLKVECVCKMKVTAFYKAVPMQIWNLFS